MTSLASQLKKLALPQTQQSQLSRDREKASLLFDPKEASSLDRETFYALGVNGLEELIGIDPSFQDYEVTLFDEASKSLERSIQSVEINQKLNKKISEFLLRLSPYFLLKPAQKTLEWLIHRFYIHQYNVDDLLMCVLPYHETMIFVRVIQLLKVADPTHKWHWLHPIQKPGVALARSTLLNHCYKDAGFLHFICEMVPKSIKAHGVTSSSTASLRVLFSFYTSTVIGMIEYCNTVTEILLSNLIPYILKGLKSTYSDYKAASYMIICQLVTKTTLKMNFLDPFIKSVCKHTSGDLAAEAVMCIVVICQTQKIEKLPKKAVKSLSKLDGIIQILEQLSLSTNIRPFMEVFLQRIVTNTFAEGVAMATSSEGENDFSAGPVYSTLLENVIHDVAMTTETVDILARLLIQEFLEFSLDEDKRYSTENVQVIKEKIHPIIQALEQKYPVSVDKALENMLKEIESQKEKDILQEFISMTVSRSKYQVVDESQTSLLLSLNHPSGRIRHSAVKYLLTKIQTGELDEFYQESLLQRLSDDDPTVVKAVLDLDEKLVDVLPGDKLYVALCGLLSVWSTHSNESWWSIEHCVLSILCSQNFFNKMAAKIDDCALAVLPYLYLVRSKEPLKEKQIALTIATSALSKKHKVLANLSESYVALTAKSNKDTVAEVNERTVTKITENMLKMKESDVLKMIHLLSDQVTDHSTNLRVKMVAKFILASLVAMSTNIRLQLSIATTLLSALGDDVNRIIDVVPKNMDEDDLDTMETEMLTADTSHIHCKALKVLSKKKNRMVKCPEFADTVFWLLDSIVMNIPLQTLLKGSHWLNCDKKPDSQDTEYIKLLLKLFEYFTAGSADSKSANHVAAFRNLLKKLIEHHLKERSKLWMFLSVMWTSHFEEFPLVPAVVQMRALHIANTSFSHLADEDMQDLFRKDSLVIPSLLVVLSCSIQPIRAAGVLCLKTIAKSCSDVSSVYQSLITTLISHTEEITADPNHIKQTLEILFANVIIVTKSVSPKKKSTKQDSDIRMLLSCLLDIVVSTDVPYHVQQNLLAVLSNVNNKMMLFKLLPMLENKLEKMKQNNLSKAECLTVQWIIRQYTNVVTEVLEDDSLALDLFMKCLNLHERLHNTVASPQELVLQQITKEFYSSIPSSSVQQSILCLLFDLHVDSTSSQTATLISKTLKGLRLDAEQIIIELNKVNKCTGAATVKQAKRVKRQEKATDDGDNVFESREWMRITLICEFLQHKKKINNSQLLVPVLFNLLSQCFEAETADQISTEYIKQLILSSILNICNKLSPDNKPLPSDVLTEEQFKVELIIQCIRVSDNPQTHHHAMLLLATAAGIFPEHVLHNIMSIFTFMGTNLLRQDDSYSSQVINKIVETVIPVLIKASEEEILKEKLGGGIDEIVAMVIQVFVDALPHIPAHRKQPVFHQLIGTLGGDRFLWMTVVLLLVCHVDTSTQKDDVVDKGITGLNTDIEFCLSICNNCAPHVQVNNMIKILKYLGTLPEDKEESATPHKRIIGTRRKSQLKKTHQLFDVEKHTAKQLRQFKYTVVNFIPHLISSSTYISQVAALSVEETNTMKTLYQSLLEENLRYIACIARLLEKNHDKPTVKFWRALLHKAYDVLDKINALLPTHIFINVVSGLMHNDIAAVRRKAMELLNNKLTQHKEPFNEQQVSLLLALVPELVSVTKATKIVGGGLSELDVNRQTALYSLKLLCKVLGCDNPQHFTPVMDIVTKVFSTKDINSQVAASALLCLAELCSSLKAHCIPYLNKFMPSLVTILDNKDHLKSHDLLLLSAVTALHKVVDNLTHFLSPYLLDILTKVSALFALDKDEKSQLTMRLKAIHQKLSSTVSPRVLLPVITQCYHHVVDEHELSIIPLMSVLGDSISSMSKEDMTAHQTSLLNLFLSVFDYRASHPQVSMVTIEEIERSSINAFLSLVMKSSEATFKPIFFKLYDWATQTGAHKERLLTFYRLSDNIAEKLKGLFTLFAGHIVKNCATLLNDNNSSKTDLKFFEIDGDEDEEAQSVDEKSTLLLQYIIGCLHKCFLYDTEGFLNRERFECLMQPIVDQIDNLQGGIEVYKERMTSYLTPCIGQLLVAAGDDSSWKPLNYQVLLKMRSDSAKVRFAALTVLQEIHSKLGEDFQILIPEAIPFLAELLEDESEEVEKQCHQVIEEIEKTFGESLQKYF
uniref:HEAT repeat-containing protein 1 n=1 Tax=Saccoglossus kowalevskii TaxID=10224 RepID=A0ABM0GU76_SACKO|nr:PREDICTED: LOW QUALITY PROTEIN: HEAT repeat-containing protein 1 [Saccoglossus kowalevskii]